MVELLDCLGLRCPQPVLKIAIKAARMSAGDTLEVLADCPTFRQDVEKWCNDMGKVLVNVVDEGGDKKKAIIQL